VLSFFFNLRDTRDTRRKWGNFEELSADLTRTLLRDTRNEI